MGRPTRATGWDCYGWQPDGMPTYCRSSRSGLKPPHSSGSTRRGYVRPVVSNAMSQAHDYRKHAGDARQQAETASRPEDRTMWLRIAEQWMRLATEAETQGSMW
jgi:hypothetical protein